MQVTVITQVYNAQKYIKQCIESVLKQTYTDFEYIIIDNGSADGSSEVIQQYSQLDNRIKLIRYDENIRTVRWIEPLLELGNNNYFTVLDADDWLEPDYLKHLVKLAETTDSDIVVTGTAMHIEGTVQIQNREVHQRLVLDRLKFPKYFTIYHAFFRTYWGKLIRTSLFRSVGLIDIKKIGLGYGSDTLYAFAWLRHANRICIDNSVLHHYRINQKSVSHKYDPRQSFSDEYLYNDAIDFLSAYGPVSSENQRFLYFVYANALKDTQVNLANAYIPAEEKMREYRKMLLRDLTKTVYSIRHEVTDSSKKQLLIGVILCACELTEENEDFRAILEAYMPTVAPAVSVKNFKYFRISEAILDALINDDPDIIVQKFMDVLSDPGYAEHYGEFINILRVLTRDDPMLCDINNVNFLRLIRSPYVWMFRGRRAYVNALKEMTINLKKGLLYSEKYISMQIELAKMLDLKDELILGKTALARFYAEMGQYDECRAVLAELKEMGAEDNDMIKAIKDSLE